MWLFFTYSRDGIIQLEVEFSHSMRQGTISRSGCFGSMTEAVLVLRGWLQKQYHVEYENNTISCCTHEKHWQAKRFLTATRLTEALAFRIFLLGRAFSFSKQVLELLRKLLHKSIPRNRNTLSFPEFPLKIFTHCFAFWRAIIAANEGFQHPTYHFPTFGSRWIRHSAAQSFFWLEIIDLKVSVMF